MRIEALLLLGIGAFFAIIGFFYWFIPVWTNRAPENSGTLMMVGSVLLGALPGSYYLWWSKHMKPRPEDLKEATIEDGAGVVGSFPGSSIWPFVLGMGAFLVALSAVFGFWFLILAGVLIVMAASGYTVESRRGGQV